MATWAPRAPAVSARVRSREEQRDAEEGRRRRWGVAQVLVRIHFIVVMIRWTGLAPWEFEFQRDAEEGRRRRRGVAQVCFFFCFFITLEPRVE